MVFIAPICFNPAVFTLFRFLTAMRLFLFSLMAVLACWIPGGANAGIALPVDESSAVILAYHRIGEDSYPESNLTTEQFTAHMQELSGGAYTILPLPDVIKALKNGDKLPPRSIVITFEGAYTSAYENAMKSLLEKKIPFTVFFSSGYADEAPAGQHLGWDELRNLQKTGLVTFGLLPAAYTRLTDKSTEEILTQVNKARISFREKLQGEPAYFSYPFGEYSKSLTALMAEQGFDAAFGLQSGAAFTGSNFYALPRFTMTESYGDGARFQLVSNAIPLPATGVEPQDPQIDTDNPSVGFTIDPALTPYLESLSCFVSGQAQPTTEVLGQNRVELRFAEALSGEKTRINCTMPGPAPEFGEEQEWRWFGMVLVNKSGLPDEETLEQTSLPQDVLP
jgi:poly-beta-1,6-N-acetyl-D-glucosamine N-deacetylase